MKAYLFGYTLLKLYPDLEFLRVTTQYSSTPELRTPFLEDRIK